MFRILYRTVFSATCALLALAGCDSGKAQLQSELPPPGTLEVVSVRPLEGDQRRNLIPNGTFDEWYAGAPVPTGFNAPMPQLSILRRDAEAEVLGPLGFRAIQRWKKNDGETGVKVRFGTWVELQPKTQYELHVIASSWSGGTAIIDIFEELPDGEVKLLETQAVKVEPDVTLEEYTKTFTTGEGRRIFISSATPADIEPAGSVVWHDWYLY